MLVLINSNRKLNKEVLKRKICRVNQKEPYNLLNPLSIEANPLILNPLQIKTHKISPTKRKKSLEMVDLHFLIMMTHIHQFKRYLGLNIFQCYKKTQMILTHMNFLFQLKS